MMRRKREKFCTTNRAFPTIRRRRNTERSFPTHYVHVQRVRGFSKYIYLHPVYNINHNRNHAHTPVYAFEVRTPSSCLRFEMQFSFIEQSTSTATTVLNQRPPIAMQTSHLLPPITLPFILLRLLPRRPLRIHHCADPSLLPPLLPSISNLTAHLRHGFDVLSIPHL
jgi:hypothetical protein